jgi:uncharacterized phage-associated protein
MIIINKAKEKRINAILFFCKKTKHLSQTKLYKLLYFLDFFHFKEVGRPITDLEYFAWDFGPVPEKLYFEIKERNAPEEILKCFYEKRDDLTSEIKGIFFKSMKNPDLEIFSEREREILEKVAYIFRDTKAEQMTEISHLKNEPWDKTIKAKGKKEKIDFLLALDIDASIKKELAIERQELSQEMRDIFEIK